MIVNMKTKIKLQNKHTIEQLEEAIKKSKDAEQKTRLRALIKLKNKNNRSEVAKEFVVSRKSLLFWIKKYNEKGIDGLIFNKGGRPEGNLKWNQKIFNDLAEEIKKNNHYWSIPIMQEWIKENKKENIPLQTIWYHVKIMNFSYKSARPHPYKGNKETQEAFKKGA
jgi:transposase